MSTAAISTGPTFEIRFRSLFRAGMALAFPCDASGHVDLDGLPQRARDNYFFARTMVGRDFDVPCIEVSVPSAGRKASPG